MSKPSQRLLVLSKLFVVYLNFIVWQTGEFSAAAAAPAPASTPPSLSLSPPPLPPLPLLPPDEVSTLITVRNKLGIKISQYIRRTYCKDILSSYGISIRCDCTYDSNTVCHVTKYSMDRLGLTTVIPDELGQLPELQFLILSNNNLQGPIPTALGKLENLQTLDLSRNQLTGSIPDLGGLKNLQWLYLQYNLLDGHIPPSLGSLVNLRELYLQFNNLSGSIPEELGKLIKLTALDISENQLIGPLHERLGDLKPLTSFWASANSLTGPIPDTFGKLTNLRNFLIPGNSMSGPLPVDIIKSWTKIETLSLIGNNFKGNLTKEIFNLPNLQYLLISDLEDATFELPSEIENTNYVSLILRNCSINGSIPKYIGEMKSLQYLDLSFNNLTGGLPELELKLIYMSFSRNMLNGTIPAWILQSVDTRIDLSFNNLSATDSQTSGNPDLNLFACCNSSAPTEPERMDPLEMMMTYCQGKEQKYHSLFINCGGGETTVNGVTYEQDNDTARFFISPNRNWAYSSSGDYLQRNASSSDYIKNMTCGSSVAEAPLYDRARISPVSLKYYAFCLREGQYNVSLKFAEIVYNEDTDYSSLRRRAFDIYVHPAVQDDNVNPLHDFDISESAHGPDKPITKNFTAVISKNNTLLTIHMYWRGKGSSLGNGPAFNGPLISAISVIPDFEIDDGKLKPWQIALIVICPIIAAVLLLVFAWKEWLRRKYSSKIKVGEDKHVTLKQLIDATGNFSDKKIVGSGSLGTVYKAELQIPQSQPQGRSKTTVAVKKLSSNFKENIQKVKKEIILLHELSHENLIKMFDYHIEKDLQLLVYEYMENGSLEDALNVDPNTRTRRYPWDTRVNICLGIAKGLKYLHEHDNVKVIAHMNIKPVNILLDGNFEPKISDFGFSHLLVEVDQFKVMKREVAQGYMAPEFFQGILSPQIDVYSFGVILFEIVSWKKNVTKTNEATEVLAFLAIKKHEQGKLEDMIDKTMGACDTQQALTILKLALKCTSVDPGMRPSMSDVVSVLQNKKTINQIGSAAPNVGEKIEASGDVSSAPANVGEKNKGSGDVASSLGATSAGLTSSPSDSSPSTRER